MLKLEDIKNSRRNGGGDAVHVAGVTIVTNDIDLVCEDVPEGQRQDIGCRDASAY